MASALCPFRWAWKMPCSLLLEDETSARIPTGRFARQAHYGDCSDRDPASHAGSNDHLADFPGSRHTNPAVRLCRESRSETRVYRHCRTRWLSDGPGAEHDREDWIFYGPGGWP